MPRHKDSTHYCPTRPAGGPKDERVRKGVAQHNGRPSRTRCYHLACGTTVWRGLRDFNGYGWTPTYHMTPAAKREIIECPTCHGVLDHGTTAGEMPITLE